MIADGEPDPSQSAPSTPDEISRKRVRARVGSHAVDRTVTIIRFRVVRAHPHHVRAAVLRAVLEQVSERMLYQRRVHTPQGQSPQLHDDAGSPMRSISRAAQIDDIIHDAQSRLNLIAPVSDASSQYLRNVLGHVARWSKMRWLVLGGLLH